jgi:NADPH:quinone reductase-like Zn-dependent oxidoreductase
MRVASFRASQKVVFFVANFNREDFMALKELLQSDRVKTVIDQSYPLCEISEAMRHLGTGHAKGKIIVAMN